MKLQFFSFLLLLAVFSFSGCGGENAAPTTPDEAKVKIKTDTDEKPMMQKPDFEGVSP